MRNDNVIAKVVNDDLIFLGTQHIQALTKQKENFDENTIYNFLKLRLASELENIIRLDICRNLNNSNFVMVHRKAK